MATLGEFARRMRQLGREVERNTNRLTRQTALAIDQAVVLATPVDTGRARSNWIVSLNAPDHSIRDPYAPGKNQGTGEGANASGALSQARGVIASRTSGTDIYIQNNLPYIGVLNKGSSAQAPANFIETAIQVGKAVVRTKKVLR